ncbi:MAG: type III-B CRISPR module RAMP protein Cmr6 [Nitrospirae bacterium]|nr:type III-B CRISPR module RAMP protein Cmr6 [Nitrospirota bacterium]
MKLPLPAETREYFRDDKSRLLKISNLGLLFNKYVYSWQDGWQKKDENAREFRDDISKIQFDKKYALSVYARQKAVVQGLQNSGWHDESFELTSDTRLIIGLGGTSVIETGMTLHPLYGFPYLPASGLKGLARAYAEIGCDAPKEELLEVFGSEEKDSRNAVNNQQGNVFFMDGLPVTFPRLELDIMNPHYGEYYQGDKPPADYLNPVPVTFLTVAPGQTFSFALFSRDEGVAVKAKKWLMGGLAELGAGGKTNVGYGYFRSSATPTKQVGQNPQVTKVNSVSQPTLWENASLTWNPGNMILLARKDNKKAEIKLGNNKDIVPEALRSKLFEKKRTITANVIVEPVGNNFGIVEIK